MPERSPGRKRGPNTIQRAIAAGAMTRHEGLRSGKGSRGTSQQRSLRVARVTDPNERLTHATKPPRPRARRQRAHTGSNFLHTSSSCTSRAKARTRRSRARFAAPGTRSPSRRRSREVDLPAQAPAGNERGYGFIAATIAARAPDQPGSVDQVNDEPPMETSAGSWANSANRSHVARRSRCAGTPAGSRKR